MIVTEYLNENQIRHYSDERLYLRQIETGEIYCDAVDVIPCMYTYEETDMVIPRPKPDEHED